jgi:membrane-bound metal-dependent hydrolase YbcI (DUF457 family)
MFVGHFAVGFAGKRAAPVVSLGTLFLAAEFLDVLWPSFLILGIESVRIVPGITEASPLDFVSYPYSHSLLAAAVWSVLFSLVYWLIRRRPRESVLLGLVVMSHWVLDFITHRPDLALTPVSRLRVGLGLWYSRPASLAVELLLFFIGILLYARSTRASDRIGRYGLWGLVGFLLASYLAAAFGPPPPSAGALAWGGQSVWLLIIWGYWLDRHRSTA